MKNIPFVSFYEKHKISPVHQNINDKKSHFVRRESLYLTLGLPPAWLKEKEVIEFGPGSGHNSLYTASLQPKKYCLVDGNAVGITEAKKLFSHKKTKQQLKKMSFIKKLFFEHQSKKKYDLVLAEACIPYQKNPEKILKHITSFTSKRGLFVCTAVTGISVLPEMVRRLMMNIIVPKSTSFENALKILEPYYQTHLAKCFGMNRSSTHWIMDNILHPLHNKKLLPIPAIINSLQKEFYFFSSSPRFVQDWRWYKNIKLEYNNHATEQYYKTNINLLDCRNSHNYHDTKYGKKIENLGLMAWNKMCDAQKSFSKQSLESFLDVFEEIKLMIQRKNQNTAKAMNEAVAYLRAGAPKQYCLKELPSWWGRGQQYVSFVKR